jgi:hypothetical protein
MGQIKKEVEQYYTAQIRRLIVIDPSMSIREMTEHLAENNIKLDHRYIAELKRKVLKNRAMNADRMTMNMALGKFAEALEETKKEAWIIAMKASTPPRVKVAALREIRSAESELFDKLFDAGVFTRKLGEVDLNVLRNKPLDPNKIDEVLENMKNWGFDPTAPIANPQKVIEGQAVSE